MIDLYKNIYKGKTVLVTGHSGFKGSWLSLWLKELGANVVGVSIDVPTNPSNFNASSLEDLIDSNFIDIRNLDLLSDLFKKKEPDYIFHLAAQALVRKSHQDPVSTFSTNAIGTTNVLECIRNMQKEAVAIIITSDKAYDNVEWSWGYRETDQLGGKDPYSASKGMAELAIKAYFHSYIQDYDGKISLGIGRAGNVIGGGDWAEDRIVPDCVKCWSKDNSVEIRKPNSTRPWQHVLEPLSGYLSLGAELTNNKAINGEAYNFGPDSNQDRTVKDLIVEMKRYWKKADWVDVSSGKEEFHEAGLLKLNCDKALKDLDWRPTLQFEETVRMTSEWYNRYYESDETDMQEFTLDQINQYIDFANKRKISWAK